jgi:type VI secretion system protein ImpA
MPEPVLEELLQPIPGANPAGDDLRYLDIYEKIKEARRQDDGLAQGAWQHERKLADYAAVAEMARLALATRSKDLQLAAWLTEALLRQNGFAGLRTGLALCAELVERFWDHLYPRLEDGDAELRAASLAWLGGKLDVAVKSVPLTREGHDWFRFKESRVVGYEASAVTPEQKKAREKALKEGKLAAEVFDKALAETPRSHYLQCRQDLDGTLATLAVLDEVCGRRFADAAPGFGNLRSALEEVRHTVNGLVEKKLGAVTETPAVKAEAAAPSPPAAPAAATAALAIAPLAAPQPESDSFEQATSALKAGRQQEAVQILNRDLATQATGRSRFLRKLQLARVCLAAGKDAIAQPLLEDLVATIDAHKLDEWEERETVAAALVTILQANKRIQGDAKEKQKLFERICRLDPAQAMAV